MIDDWAEWNNGLKIRFYFGNICDFAGRHPELCVTHKLLSPDICPGFSRTRPFSDKKCEYGVESSIDTNFKKKHRQLLWLIVLRIIFFNNSLCWSTLIVCHANKYLLPDGCHASLQIAMTFLFQLSDGSISDGCHSFISIRFSFRVPAGSASWGWSCA